MCRQFIGATVSNNWMATLTVKKNNLAAYNFEGEGFNYCLYCTGNNIDD